MEPRVPKVEFMTQNGQQPLQVNNSSPQQSAMPSQKDEDKMPLFLIKLWNIVEDPAYQSIIRWDESGYSFHIVDPYSFCRNVLPHYFKHNNLNSLIRQLNMYGFRKVSPLDKGGLTRSESDQDHLEFSHTCFIRGRPDLMVNIKRRQANRTVDNTSMAVQTQSNLTVVMDELSQLREKQRNMDSKMNDLTKENEALWEQLDHVRQQHNRQQQIVNKLVQFLVAIVQPNMSKRVLKRGVLAIDEPPPKRTRSANSQNSGNNIVDMLDRLQREIVEGGGLQQQKGYQNDRGPIIADVTDEVYTGSPTNGPRPAEPHISSPGSSDQMGQMRYGHITGNPQPPQNVPYQQKVGYAAPQTARYPPPATAIPAKTGNLNQAGGSNEVGRRSQRDKSAQIAPANYIPSLSMSPALERQISQELQDYLNGVDVNIDSCRDLLNGDWNLDFLENLGDEETDANQQHHGGHARLALEQPPPVHYGDNLDFFGDVPDVGAEDIAQPVSLLPEPSQGYPVQLNAQYDQPTCSTPSLLTPCTSPTYR